MTNEFLPAPKNYDEAMKLAEIMASSQLVPQTFRNHPQDIMMAMMWSHTLGIPVVQGLQYICVINGKPCIYGDGMLAIVMGSGKLADIKEEIVGEGDGRVAKCTVWRRGKETPVIGTYSMAEARQATLLTKDSWRKFPARMLKMRARAYALRDAFPDVIAGIGAAEEQDDVIESTAVEVNRPEQTAEEPRKMPRRKKAATADEAVVEDAVVAQPEEQPQQTEPAAEEVPQEKTPSETAAPTKEQVEEPKTPSKDVEEVFQKLHQARTRQDLMQIWRSLPFDIQSDQEMVSAFQKRQADISLAESEGAAQ